MQQNITVNKWIKLGLLICILVYLYFIIRTVHIRDYGDDQFFLPIFHSDHILSSVINRFYSWTGRFTLELLMISTIGYSAFWKVAIPCSVIILCISICRISNFKVGVVPLSLFLLLFSSIPYGINNDASWWITGFYNYLLPVATAVYAFSISYGNISNIFERVLSVIFVFCFAYMEQAGISYILGMLCLLALKKESRNAFNLSIFTLALINLIISLKAPGNEVRSSLEVWRWYPQYQTYGIINKLALGFDKLHQAMTLKYNIPLIAFVAALFYLGSISKNKSISVKISLILLASFVAISISNSFTNLLGTGSFFFNYSIKADYWSTGKIYLSYLYLFLVISSSFLIMLDLLLKEITSASPTIIMLIGFMTVTMMGMSPTVYASSLRVDFMFEITCIISTGYLINKIINTRYLDKENPSFRN